MGREETRSDTLSATTRRPGRRPPSTTSTFPRGRVPSGVRDEARGVNASAAYRPRIAPGAGMQANAGVCIARNRLSKTESATLRGVEDYMSKYKLRVAERVCAAL